MRRQRRRSASPVAGRQGPDEDGVSSGGCGGPPSPRAYASLLSRPAAHPCSHPARAIPLKPQLCFSEGRGRARPSCPAGSGSKAVKDLEGLSSRAEKAK